MENEKSDRREPDYCREEVRDAKEPKRSPPRAAHNVTTNDGQKKELQEV